MRGYLSNIKQITPFLIGTMLFILTGLSVILLNNKTELHISMNYGHNYYFDQFFKYFTHAGDGLFAVGLIILLGVIYFKKYRWKLIILGLTTIILSGAITQSLKHLVFPDADRPIRFIGKKFLSLVQGVEMNEFHSFPSGHTTTAFALFCILSYVFAAKNKSLQIAFLLAAILAGYSRIYLSQHFLEDVITGAFIGTATFVIVHLGMRLMGQKIN